MKVLVINDEFFSEKKCLEALCDLVEEHGLELITISDREKRPKEGHRLKMPCPREMIITNAKEVDPRIPVAVRKCRQTALDKVPLFGLPGKSPETISTILELCGFDRNDFILDTSDSLKPYAEGKGAWFFKADSPETFQKCFEEIRKKLDERKSGFSDDLLEVVRLILKTTV